MNLESKKLLEPLAQQADEKGELLPEPRVFSQVEVAAVVGGPTIINGSG